MTALASSRPAVRPLDFPAVLVFGAIGVFVSARVAWAARGGAIVLLVPPLLVGLLVASGAARVLLDLRSARAMSERLAAFGGRESECPTDLIQDAKTLIDRASSTLPSICILVGLLGTFAGLFEALVGARDLLGAAVDTAALRQIVVAPLSGLARAFGSSAAGIVGSIVLGAAEGRFQRVADAIAVVVEGVDEGRRSVALGDQLRSVLEATQAKTAETSVRDARVEALLERVAKAAESQSKERESIVAALGALSSAVMQQGDAAQKLVTREGDATRSTLSALDAALRMAQTATAHAATLQSESLVSQSADFRRAVVEQGERLVSALQATSSTWSFATVEALLADVKAELRSGTASTSTALVSLEASIGVAGNAFRAASEATLARMAESQTATAQEMFASYTNEQSAAARVHSTAAESLVAAAVALQVASENVPSAMKAVDDAAKAHWANAEATLRSTLGDLARSSQAAVVEMQGASAVQIAQARDANEATARAMTDALAEALRAWELREGTRYEREEQERKVRWDDADAQRSEWSGAEKIVLQSAMEMVAERLVVAAEVQAKALETVEGAARSLASVEEARNQSAQREEARAAGAERSLRDAMVAGSDALGEALRREAGGLVDAARAEIARGVQSLDAHATAVAERFSDGAASASAREEAVEGHARDLAVHAGDVARAVETLAEVLRAVPLGGGQASSDSGAVPGGQGASDEDRAAFVACLEEARRWFDASQVLQQRLLDEVASVRGAGVRP